MQNEFNSVEIETILTQFKAEQAYLLQALHALQEARPRHYLSVEILDAVAKYFNITKGSLYGIATYYSMYSVTPRGKYLIRVCKSPVCQMMGANTILDEFSKRWNIRVNETTADGLFTLELSECLGRCGKAPSMAINDKVYTELTNDKIDEILLNLKQSEQ